jgi:AcrR family transcriptional regulator
MDEQVKTRPGRRERKALATRRRVLDAAEMLFTRDGYAATTMTAIAEAADVAVQTVYAIFGAKRAILTQLLDARIVGDDQRTPLRDRADWQAMERETGPRRQLALLASISTQIGNRIAALLEVMAAAAGSDPEIAATYQRQQEARYKDQRRLTESLSRKGALRAGLSEAHATDIIWTLANAHTHRTLVSERRWATDEYERWLGQVLACALLTEPST